MIGIFDSGVGGFTVAKEIMKELPKYDLIYFGDTARTPYGNKSREAIVKYAIQDADFLIKKGAKMLVIACNTASAYAYDALREKYPEVPIFEVIMPAANLATLSSNNKKIGVIGTRATIKSGVYEEKIRDANMRMHANDANVVSIFSASCPLFVPMIEEGWTSRPEIKTVVRRYLADLKRKNIDTLILGCTHYPIIKNIIQEKIGRRVRLIDSAEAVAKEIKVFLENNSAVDGALRKGGKAEFYMSDVTEQNQKVANKFLGKNIKINEVLL